MSNLIKIKTMMVILLIVGGCIIGGCKNPDENIDNEEIQLKVYSVINEGIFYLDENEFVRLYYSPESGFINDPIELILENNTKRFLTFGMEFSLEYFDNEKWTEIELDVEFPLIELGMYGGETSKGQFNLSLIEEYNDGKEGRYRYVKNLGLSSELGNADCVGFTLYAELEVKIK